jgi:hypothetical protein
LKLYGLFTSFNTQTLSLCRCGRRGLCHHHARHYHGHCNQHIWNLDANVSTKYKMLGCRLKIVLRRQQDTAHNTRTHITVASHRSMQLNSRNYIRKLKTPSVPVNTQEPAVSWRSTLLQHHNLPTSDTTYTNYTKSDVLRV